MGSRSSASPSPTSRMTARSSCPSPSTCAAAARSTPRSTRFADASARPRSPAPSCSGETQAWSCRSCLTEPALVRDHGRPAAVRGTPASSLPPQRTHLDRAHLGNRVRGRDLDGLLEAAALDQVEAADRLLRRHERTVSDDRLAVTNPHGAATPRRRQLVARDPRALRLELVEPRKALL